VIRPSIGKRCATRQDVSLTTALRTTYRARFQDPGVLSFLISENDWKPPPNERFGCFAAKRPGEHVSQRLSDEAGVISPNAAFGKLRIPDELFCTCGVCASPLFRLENISCAVAYKVVGCNYGVGERRAPAKTQ